MLISLIAKTKTSLSKLLINKGSHMFLEDYVNHFFRVKKKFSQFHISPKKDEIVYVTSIRNVDSIEQIIDITFINNELRPQKQYFYARDLKHYFELID